MWTVSTSSRPVISHEKLLIDYPEADLILRSRDSYEFRVLKQFIVYNSPILEEQVLIAHNSQPEQTASTILAESDVDSEHTANAFQVQVPVVQLPVDGAILFSLLTYIFPLLPVLPTTVEQVIELLSVAQMYKMDAVLSHIRNHIAQQEPPFIREETAFLIYSLSQRHGLHLETIQAARCTLSIATLTIGYLAKENLLDVPGAFLHELWKYHKRVRSNLKTELRKLAIPDISICHSLADWLNSYIFKIGADDTPVTLNRTDFYMKLKTYVQERHLRIKCSDCRYIPEENISAFWEALTAVIYNSTVKAGSDFTFPIEGTRSKSEGQARQTRETSFLRKYSNMANADVILRSSDLVDFHVHRSILIASSPCFRDMFSLPQPPNCAVPNTLPVVHLSEDAETLDSLISMLYPVDPEMPPSNDSVIALLAAAAKYDMDAVQSSIRVEIDRRGLLSSTPPELFRLYAVACSKGLIPEMESLARLTLHHPLTFESLGDTLRSFEGRALCHLADFRLRSMRDFITKSILFFENHEGPSKIWAESGCRPLKRRPCWLTDCSWVKLPDGTGTACKDSFTNTIPTNEQLCDKYLKTLLKHVAGVGCNSCLRVHALEGDKYRENLKGLLTQVRDVRF